MDTRLKQEILTGILLEGSSSAGGLHIVINPSMETITTKSGGKLSIRKAVIPRFNLLLFPTDVLEVINPLQLRCCICREVIKYPVWLYVDRRTKKELYYFVCFTSTEVSTLCYKGD